MSGFGASSGNPPSSGDVIAQVLSATDIVELIGRSVSLKRRGKDFLGLCPFHTEKTPSFSVSPSKQVFYCQGCKKGGSAFTFVMERDRIEFKEALHLLAREANIEIPQYGGNKEKASQRQAMYDAHSAAAQFFSRNLADPRIGQPAREYLAKRGFTPETTQKFQIGLALDAWDGLANSPLMRKFPPGELAVAGLLKPRNNGPGHYDTFRNRLMFPIRDDQGRIMAFGGRVMPGSEDPAKYLNSPETPLFSKSRCIYGLDMARPHIVSAAVRTAVIVEGYTDVVMAHQFGVGNVVSVLGTALTEQHVHLLRRFADRIVLLFDGDAAGGSAADRSLELFLTQPIEIAIASLPPGIDPDEMLLNHGADGFRKVIDTAEDALSYKWKALEKQYEATSDLTGKQKAIEQYLSALSDARGAGPIDPIRWGQAVARVSRLTDIPAAELHARFKGRSGAKAGGNVRYNRNGATGAAAGFKVSDGDWSKTTSQAGSTGPTVSTIRGARERAEDQILGLLLHEPGQWIAIQAEIGPEDFLGTVRRSLAEIYWDHQRHEGEPVFSQFLALLNGEQAELAMRLSSEAESTPQNDETTAGNVSYLVQQRFASAERKHLADLQRRSGEHEPAKSADLVANSADSTVIGAGSTASRTESLENSPENGQNSPNLPLTAETARLGYSTANSDDAPPKDNALEASAREILKLRFERAKKTDLRRIVP